MISGQVMTIIGAFCAMLAFLQVGLPGDTPVYVKLSIGALNAFLSYYLGQTNKGTIVPVEPKVIIQSTTVDKKDA